MRQALMLAPMRPGTAHLPGAFDRSALASRQVATDALTLAWGFVAARMLHSLVHLTYNNVYHRLPCFAAGVLLPIALWGLLFPRLF